MEVLLQTGDDETIQYVQRLLSTESGFVAAVNTLHAPFVPPVGPYEYSSAIWVSNDGRAWNVVDTGDLFTRTRVFELLSPAGGPMILYGTTEMGQNEAWTSVDGRSWTAVAAPAGFQGLIDVADGPLGFVAAVTQADVPIGRTDLAIYLSSDGLAWERTYTLTTDRSASFWGTGAGPEGVVVVGTHSDQGGSTVAFTLASSDGRTWFESPAGSFEDDLVTAVAPIGNDWVVAGYAKDGILPLYWSANGLDWEKTAGISDPGGFEFPGEEESYFGSPSNLVSTGGMLILSGARAAEGGDSRPAAAWTSPDGREWHLLDLGRDPEIRSAIRLDGSYLVGGRLGDERGDAVIWQAVEEWFE